MCVIVYIPKNQTLDDEIIRACHRANPDGMGMCSPSVSYRGMSIDTLLRSVHERPTDEPCLLHFRLATHGSIKRGNCHPFLDNSTNTWFMHNGILNIDPKGDMTDSETAFREILAPEIQTHGLRSDGLRYAVKQIIGSSRFAFMQGDDVMLWGKYEKWMGCWFSNLRFTYRLYC